MVNLRLLRVALMILPLSACSVFHIWDPLNVRRGALIDPDSLKELIPGTSTRADVTSVLGSPTARATFDDNSWIYYTAVTTTRIGRVPAVTKQSVLVCNFDANGTLRSIRQLDKKDAKQVAMAPGATPSPGSEASFMQQLLGNVGKFTPAGIPGGSSSSTPGGTNTIR